MKKSGILNKKLSNTIASMDHTDKLTICDAGLPIPMSVLRIDLSIMHGFPPLIDVCKAVAGDLEVEHIILAEEIKEKNPEIKRSILNLFKDAEVHYVSHEEFKEKTRDSKAIVRTGECSPYANVILISGVIL